MRIPTSIPPLSAPGPIGGLILALLLALGTSSPIAWGQGPNPVPNPGYYGAIERLYEGDYSDARRSFNQQVRGAIKTVQSRWIDSICYHAMLGETFYQMGDNRAALAEFNAAADLFLNYPRWLLKVNFRDPGIENNPARLTPPWGRPTRQVTVGKFNDTMLVSQGELLTEDRLRQGGPVQGLQNWPVRVPEILRATALTIRRRNELLGPLGPHDSMSKSLRDALNRGGNAPRNHWSNAWTELLLAHAQHGVGESQQAMTHYARAVLVDGRFDHPLTGAALLGQAQLAMEAGNAQAALQLALEASYSGYVFEDYDVIGEAFRLAHVAHLASGGRGVLPALSPAAAWAERERLDHLATLIRTCEAEQLVLAGDIKGSAARLGAINARRREIPAGRLGPQRRHVEALIAYANGNIDQGDKVAAEGIRQLRDQSLRNWHISLANERIDGGEISSRIAVELYTLLLRDPTPRDWQLEPFDTITHISTPHEGSLARWLAATLERKDVLPALEITEITKRRRFWLAQPLGSRLVALRHLLETPADRLSPAARLQRQALLVKAPRYGQLLEEDRALRAEVAAEPLMDASGRIPPKQSARYKKLRDNIRDRELLLRQFALRRDASDLNVPPRLTGEELQKALPPGRALLVFHQSGNNMFGFLIVAEGYHTWRLPPPARLSEQASEVLRGLGNFSRQKTLTLKELTSDDWRAVADPLASALLDNSRLDLSQTQELIVVPDGVLWHVPFEVLAPKIGGNTQLLVDRTPIRYVPTASFGVGDYVAPRPVRNTAIVSAGGGPSQDPLAARLEEELREAVANPLPVPATSSVSPTLFASLVDQLIVLPEADLDPASPYSLIPAPLDRNNGNLADWLRLPLVDCQRVILAGLHTAAEQGIKTRRRSRGGSDSNIQEGQELFHLGCALLASGTKTALVTRWPTGGQTHRDLLREFVRELPNLPADVAWQRSVLLARRTELDPEQEPRYKRPNQVTEIPTAEHPILWAGYLLFDTGYDATLEPVAPNPGNEPGAMPPPGAPAAGGPGAAGMPNPPGGGAAPPPVQAAPEGAPAAPSGVPPAGGQAPPPVDES